MKIQEFLPVPAVSILKILLPHLQLSVLNLATVQPCSSDNTHLSVSLQVILDNQTTFYS